MKITLSILLLLLITGLMTMLFAQAVDEDQQLMREYKLPEQAVPDTGLTVRDSLTFQNGKPFTGTEYSRYNNGQLQHAIQFINGMKHGTMMVWYPDGRPQLLSNYRKGHLNGRFKGWYQFGAVIYDLVLKDNALEGDLMYDEDTNRETAPSVDTEGTGDGKDQSNGE